MDADRADPGPADGAPGTDGGAPEKRIPRTAVDVTRLGLAAGAGVVIGGGAGVFAFFVDHGRFGFSALAVALLIGVAAGSIVYILHTLLVFYPLSADQLHRALLGSRPTGRFGTLGQLLSGTGPVIAAQWSVIAIATVLVFAVWPWLLREPLTVWTAIVVVATSWLATLVAYAVHYARFDAASGGMQFPDGNGRVFGDYVYLAVQVQTTFSTSDVSLTSASARAIVTGHTLVSFAFNTVIIAMLITILFIGG
jgi:uncharacterized membrane protein